MSTFPQWLQHQGRLPGITLIPLGDMASMFMAPHFGGFGNDSAEAAINSTLNQPSTKTVTASASAIRQLPTVKVSREDLIEPSNRECCICLEPIELNSRATRLPCAHLFHPNCITNWLKSSSCSCPVCRFELPTDDPEFEVTRKQRMRNRKLRFAKHELDRLSGPQLLQLLPRNTQKKMHFVDKQNIHNYLISEQIIDLVPTPPPVDIRWSKVAGFSIAELRHFMNEEAGVFFDSAEVVEKSDMLNILVNSGRINIVPEEEEAKELEASNSRLFVETVASDGEASEEVDERNDRTILMEEDTSFDDTGNIVPEMEDSTYKGSREKTIPTESELQIDLQEIAPVEQLERETSAASRKRHRSNPELDADDEVMDAQSSSQESVSVPPHPRSASTRSVSMELQEATDGLKELSIAELLAAAEHHQVDISTCIERPEIEAQLSANVSLDCLRIPPTVKNPLDEWDISEIRALASLAKLDLSHCHSREEMIDSIQKTAVLRPQVSKYFQSLAPLARLTVPQLRAVARERQIPIGNCLEKGDIIETIVRQLSK